MKILESYSAIAKSLLLEDDDDRYVHIGYGKYKEKDSRTGEPLPNSPVYIKTDAGKYIMPDDDEKGGEEEPKGGGMGSGDFERDFGDGDEPKVPAPDSKSDTGKPRVSANPYDDNYGQEVDDDEPEDGGDVKSDVESVKKEIENAPPEVKSWYEKSIGSKVDKALTYAEDVADWWENAGYEEDEKNQFPKWGETETRSTETIEINGKKYRPIGDN